MEGQRIPVLVLWQDSSGMAWLLCEKVVPTVS